VNASECHHLLFHYQVGHSTRRRRCFSSRDFTQNHILQHKEEQKKTMTKYKQKKKHSRENMLYNTVLVGGTKIENQV
jgi:hypothetical protein